jgi:predicted pyridoxine 5'-phosphate oxidase superfamily flavin-nucleotide-binding protein
MNDQNVFHEGERAVQLRAGEAVIADRSGTVLTDTVISGARTFIAKQFMAVLGSMDSAGNVWASVLFGRPGFLHTLDGRSILVDVPECERDAGEVFWKNIETNPAVGMLFIEIGSRRRYRVNGQLVARSAEGIEIGIREAYPNCPKYIQRRKLTDMGAQVSSARAMAAGTAIRGDVAALLHQADTMFVASAHPQRGVDASHRGGNPGFIKVLDEDTLRIPDYQGNSMFNTLGNFAVDPHAGVCVPDFANNRLLQLTGEAVLRWDMDDPAGQGGGTGRFWDLKVKRWTLRDVPQRLEWEYLDASPFNPPAMGVR